VDRAGHSVVECNGAIYIGGGWYGDDQYHYQIDIYHPSTDKWDSMNTPHALFAMTVLTNKLVIVGGLTSGGHNTNNVIVLENNNFKDFTKMPTIRCRATAVNYQSMMIVMGGYDGSRRIGTTELFDVTTSQWFKCDDLPQPLSHLQASIVGDMLFVMSGADSANSPSKAVYSASLNTLSSHQLNWKQLCDSPLPCIASVALRNKCKYEADNHPWKVPINTVGVSRLPKGDKLHHKFAVIDDKIVITGSHNWSASANYNNDEALLVIENPTVAAHFSQEFARLYGRAVLGVPLTVQNKMSKQEKECF